MSLQYRRLKDEMPAGDCVHYRGNLQGSVSEHISDHVTEGSQTSGCRQRLPVHSTARFGSNSSKVNPTPPALSLPPSAIPGILLGRHGSLTPHPRGERGTTCSLRDFHPNAHEKV